MRLVLKPGGVAIAVGAVGIEEEPALAVALEAAPVDDRDRDLPAVARGHHDPLGDVLAGIVARRDALDLERLEPVVGRDDNRRRSAA